MYFALVDQSVYWLGYGQDDRVSTSGRGNDVLLFSSPPISDQLLGPHNLLSSGYRGHFLGATAAKAWIWPLTPI